MKQAWKPYGVDVEIKAPGLRNIIKWGTTTNEQNKRTRRNSKRVQQDEEREIEESLV